MENAGAAGVGGAGGGSEKPPSEPQRNSDLLVRLCTCGKRAFAPPSSDTSGSFRSSSPPVSPKKKRHCAARSSGAAEANNNDGESGGDDDGDVVVIEPPPQRPSAEKGDNASSKTDARRILVEVIQDRVEKPRPALSTPPSASGNRDERNLSWATRVWDQLGVAGTPETAQLVAAACGGAAEWLRHQRHSTGSIEHFTRKRRCATAIVDILLLLPRADNNDELARNKITTVLLSTGF
ncbi:hypothetical protein Gpo141_00002750 [Globisporangium polare]